MSAPSSQADKKMRKVNWTLSEIECLVDEVTKHSPVLFGSFSSTIMNMKKKMLWAEISNRVSACGSSTRSPEDVKKKWTTLKSDTRKKAGSQKKAMTQTGGGPPPSQLNEIEYKVVSLIPSVQIDGCAGGLESEDLPALDSGSCLGTSFGSAVPSTSSETVDSAHTSIHPPSYTPSPPSRGPAASTASTARPPSRGPVASTASTARPPSQSLSPDIVSRPSAKKQKTKAHADSSWQANEVVQLEREKVVLMREHVQVDRDRLQVEKEILMELRLMRELTFPSTTMSTTMCVSPIIHLGME